MTPGESSDGWIDRFMEAVSLSHNMTSAAQAAGISRANVYLRLQTDTAFRERFDEAKARAIERLEASVYARAHLDQRAAEFYLKAHKPEVYNVPARVQMSGPGGAPIEIRGLLEERLALIAAKLAESDAADADGSGSEPEE